VGIGGALSVGSTLSIYNGQFYLERSTSSGVGGAFRVTGDTVDRMRIRANGQMDWGDGAAATDVTLHRTAVGTLTCTGTVDASAIGTASFIGLGGASFAKSLWCAGSAGQYINIANSTGELRVNGTKVIGAQGAAVADASGGVVVDAEARAAINALLARLRTHGAIAT